MSRITVDRLSGMRRYKDELRRSMGAGVLDRLPESWLSDRGLTRSDIYEKMEKMFACADRVEASDAGENDEGRPMVDIIRANWCKTPAVCAICSARLQGRRRVIYENPIKKAVREFPHRYMVTFTVKDGPDLGGRLDHLRAAFRAWYRKGQVRRDMVSGEISRSRGESGKVRAALAGVELKKTDAGLWHCHIHALVFTDERLDYQVYDPVRLRDLKKRLGRRPSASELRSCVNTWASCGGSVVPVSKLSAEWIACSGDSVNIDCRPLRGGFIEVERQAREVLKYSSKLAGVGAEDRPAVGADLIDLVGHTYGRRLFMALRGFRGLVKRESEYDDPGKGEYSIVWDYDGHKYIGTRPALPQATRKDTLSLVGRLVGQWRRERRSLLNGRGLLPDLELAGRLDSIKAGYRQVIQSIWKTGARIDLVESCRRLVVSLPPAVASPVWVQTSLLTT